MKINIISALSKSLDFLLQPKNLNRLKKLSCLILALTVVSDILVRLVFKWHVHLFWDKIPAFSTIYGFLSCIFIIVFAKTMGHKFLMKKEDYYD